MNVRDELGERGMKEKYNQKTINELVKCNIHYTYYLQLLEYMLHTRVC